MRAAPFMGTARFYMGAGAIISNEFALAVRLINEGPVDLSPVVTHTLPMSRAREAFEFASDRQRAMKVLLDFAQAA